MKIVNEQKFWNIIEKANWKLDHDYERISKEWKKSLDKNTSLSLKEFILEKVYNLKSKFKNEWLNPNSKISLSDDGYHDLMSDIVGRGKEEYYNITLEKLIEIVNKNQFEECFTYCIHKL